MGKKIKNTKISYQLKEMIAKAVGASFEGQKLSPEAVSLEHPGTEEHGDYSSNVALVLAKQFGKNPREVAMSIVAVLEQTISGQREPFDSAQGKQGKEHNGILERVDVAGPGFINFTLSKDYLTSEIGEIEKSGQAYGTGQSRDGEKIMVEFAHPNTHKQFHIGHLRNITLGESIIRILESSGAKVTRANYQGDVGMHVAKALYGVLQMPEEYESAKKLDTRGRVAFLGKAYVLGTTKFEEDEEAKVEIVSINKQVYTRDERIVSLWKETRQWSLDYFQIIYERVYSKFDRLYFESEVANRGKELVLENVGKVFEKSEGAIIFPGEKFGLHNRVFINSEGNPTYEGKEVALAELEFKESNADLIVHNVGPEQAGYFQVVFEANAQVFPETRGKELHNVYGWVKLKEGKMSSRTGNVVLGEWLLDEIKKRLSEKYPDRVSEVEPIAIAAVKYSLLKVGSNQEIAFDIDESVSLDGDSGPYLQYTYARARSVLRKSGLPDYQTTGLPKKIVGSQVHDRPVDLASEELAILRWLYRFPEVVEMAAKNYSPNLIATYLFELAKRFNNFYNNVPILGPLRSSASPAGLNVKILGQREQGKGQSEFRLELTEATSIVLKNGLNLLGIKALEKM